MRHRLEADANRSHRAIGLVAALALALAPALPRAQESPAPTAPDAPPPATQAAATEAPPAAPPADFVPPRDGHDWIQLTSDEWLKGELKALYERKLEFDSDELGLLELDWEDVKRIRGHGLQGVRLAEQYLGEGPITVFGRVDLSGGTIVVTNAAGRQEFPRADVIAIAPGERRERSYWSGKVSLGANLRAGNSDLAEYTAQAEAKRRTPLSRFLLDYIGAYNKTESITTANNHRVTGSYDAFKTRRYFWRVIFAEWFRDPFQNIDYRLTAGSALGYHVIDTARTTYDVTVGAGGQYLRFDSVESGQAPDSSTPALSVTNEYESELTSWIDFDFDWNFYVINRQAGSYTHHLVASLETDLVGDLELDVSFVWDRIEDPQPNDDGTLPDQDDFRLIVGLGYEF